MYYTYIYHDPERNVPMYVGKGKDERAFKHLRGNKVNPQFNNRLKTLKRKNLTPNIEIMQAVSEAAAIEEEIRLIALYGRRDIHTGTLYNLTDGGEGLSNPSVDTRKKMSDGVKASYTPELRALRSAQFKAQVFSDTTRQKMSVAKIGTKRSEESRTKQSGSIRGENNHNARCWVLLTPENQIIRVLNMTEFCEQNHLNYFSLRNRAYHKDQRPISRGPSKGWSVLGY